MIDPYTASVIVFFVILGILIYRDRKKIDFNYFLLMRRTKKFRDTIERIARKSPKFWKMLGVVAFLFCIYYMISGVALISDVAYLVFSGVVKQPGMGLVLPFPSSQTTVGPGFIGIPFWFWIVVISVILIPHELFHGIMSGAEKIKLKDVGLLLMLLQFISIPAIVIYFLYTKTFDLTLFLTALFFSIPGAFVEPDDKQLNKARLMTKLRIFSAGSFINIAIGLTVVFLVQSLLWAPNVDGILITSVNSTSPAASLGLKPGMVLQSIDGKKLSMNFDEYSSLVMSISGSNTENITNLISSLVLMKTLNSYNPGEVINLTANGVNYNLMLGEHPDIKDFPYIGITSTMNTKNINLFLVVFPLLGMIAYISIFVGIFNILPLYPLDGGLIIKAITDKYAKKKSKSIVMLITLIMLALILYTVFGAYIKL